MWSSRPRAASRRPGDGNQPHWGGRRWGAPARTLAASFLISLALLRAPGERPPPPSSAGRGEQQSQWELGRRPALPALPGLHSADHWGHRGLPHPAALYPVDAQSPLHVSSWAGPPQPCMERGPLGSALHPSSLLLERCHHLISEGGHPPYSLGTAASIATPAGHRPWPLGQLLRPSFPGQMPQPHTQSMQMTPRVCLGQEHFQLWLQERTACSATPSLPATRNVPQISPGEQNNFFFF